MPSEILKIYCEDIKLISTNFASISFSSTHPNQAVETGNIAESALELSSDVIDLDTTISSKR